MRNHSNENEFDLHENGHAGETHFHINGFARRLVLTPRQKVTRKWPIVTQVDSVVCSACGGLNLSHTQLMALRDCDQKESTSYS